MPIRRAKVRIDNNDNSMLILSDNNIRYKQISSSSDKSYEIIFKTDVYASSISQFINQKKNEICETEYMMLCSFLDSAEFLFL